MRTGTFYRVLKDNFLWKKGAILDLNVGQEGNMHGYTPIDNIDIWNMSEHNGSEYISSRIIENSPEWFERIYPVLGNTGKDMFVPKKEALKQYEWEFGQDKYGKKKTE